MMRVTELIPCSRELIPCQVGINSLLRRTSFPVRAEFIAGSLGGERGFSAIYRSCGFRMHRGERRSARPSQFENLMILFSKISKFVMLFFLVQKGCAC